MNLLKNIENIELQIIHKYNFDKYNFDKYNCENKLLEN